MAFEKKMGDKVIYKTKDIVCTGNLKMRFEFVEQNSPHLQGIAIYRSRRPKFKGQLVLDEDIKLISHKSTTVFVVLWEDVGFKDFTLTAKIDEGYIAFANSSDIMVSFAESTGVSDWKEKFSQLTGKPIDQLPQGSFQSAFSIVKGPGYGFWSEQIAEHKYRFHCNDHEEDEDFDDLIFDVEIIECDDPGFSL